MLTILRFCCRLAAITIVASAVSAVAQAAAAPLPEAPSISLVATMGTASAGPLSSVLNPDSYATRFSSSTDSDVASPQEMTGTAPLQEKKKPAGDIPVDANGNPIPVDRRQPQRILGFMPNFRPVSAGAKPTPPGWKQNFKVATRQAFDFSSFIFLGLTSVSAEGLNEHKAFGKGVGGFYTYTWHGFLDKTDGTYLGAFFLPSLLHEDTRYYAVGHGSGHSYQYRILYVMSRQVVTRTYGGHATPNLAGLGGKVLTQIISRTYYPANSATFGVLAEKFAYSAMRDMIFTGIREFYPDVNGRIAKKRATKNAAAKSAADVASAAAAQSTANPPARPPPDDRPQNL